MSASNQPTRRTLRLLFALQGHTFEGLRLKQLADAVQASPSTVLRDLEVLADEGIAERIPGRDEYWRLSPRLIQLARAHEQEMARVRQRLDETDQRYSRNPN
ncbi:helix-turn-helix domain-containing protein [Stenotrophomonas sp. MMGLT7]|uniref:helix-turn-helix domain-containing protein n=1 Tax=Stenotrophomonas sp. MMGLT7 TaxID=2901227 RepID=UPI001E4FE863|nr:helix-turn-helix domain-containing protein [Stenotrophomonas sp. MMGLT7]MCD7099093.1 helix-turn-helix domain-containing protein [Stenotrophomonas sp. MMGLT7]